MKTNLTRLRGRTLRGERLTMDAPFGSRGTQTLIAGLTADALIAPWVIRGAMDRPAFAAYVSKVRVPGIEPGTVVVLDNLTTHRNVEATRALRDHGCWFLHLPPYRPTSTRSNRPSPSSRLISEGSARGHSQRCSTPSVRSVISTTRRSAGITSPPPDMSRVNVETL